MMLSPSYKLKQDARAKLIIDLQQEEREHENYSLQYETSEQDWSDEYFETIL